LAGRKIVVRFDRSHDPVRNLEREEEAFDEVERGKLPELVRLWVNNECLVRGRAKTARYGWYHRDIARRMAIPVLVRSTGGGVVFHDLGNLNWSFFLKNSGAVLPPKAIFERGSKYVVGALKRLGVPAQFSPPNRIEVENRKVSGMAARSTKRTLLVHGTLLLNSDLDKLNLLCIPPDGSPPVSNVSEWAPDIDAWKVTGALVDVLGESGFDVRMADGVI